MHGSCFVWKCKNGDMYSYLERFCKKINSRGCQPKLWLFVEFLQKSLVTFFSAVSSDVWISISQPFRFQYIGSLSSLSVPIIPSYLYTLDESTDVLKNNTAPKQDSPASFQSIVSLYDNTVRLSGFNTTARTTDLLPLTPTAAQLPPDSTDCPRSTNKLINENVKVGMLFASKATVQLITNPFVGPITNR